MYEIVNDKLTISVNDWVMCGLTINQFYHDKARFGVATVQEAKNGESRIDVSTITGRRMAVIERTMGKFDLSATTSIMEIERSKTAELYYSEYQYIDNQGKKQHLPLEVQQKYVNEASLIEYFAKRRRMMKECGRRLSKKEFFLRCVEKAKRLAESKEWFNTLPKNVRSFGRKYEEYLVGGYDTLIHSNYGNSTAEKLTESAKLWLIGRYATPVDRLTVSQLFRAYNMEVANHQGDEEEAWKTLKSENAIRQYLNRPEVRRLWYGMRYGELEAKEKYTRQHRTMLPTRRDTLWYGDGTRLNYYYIDDNGHRATMSVYEVVDVYSECLLGYQVSKTENFEDQYYAYRNALQFAGHKPYEIEFDNQGGHKKLMGGNFFKSLARVAITTMPYNGRSKTIESIFGRFQAEFLHRDWFFTGQNITAKKMESRSNMEMILANTENLPTKDEVLKTYAQRREEWNNAKHPSLDMTRLEAYRSSKNEEATAVSVLDLIEIFGITNPTPNTYRSNGIQMKLGGVQYEWEVLTAEGQPDMEFLKNNVDRKFHIKYDPKDMSIVSLYSKGKNGYRFEALAQKYIKVHRAIQDQDNLDHSFIRYMDDQNKRLRVETQMEVEAIMESIGFHPEQHSLNMPRVKGISAKKTAKYKEEIGEYTKAVSNLDLADVRNNY